jgi:hypothetical protein
MKKMTIKPVHSFLKNSMLGLMIVALALSLLVPVAYADKGKDKDDKDGEKSQKISQKENKFWKFDGKFDGKFFRNFVLPPGISKKVNPKHSTTTDTTAPSISNLSISDIKGKSAKVTWMTNEKADGYVWYSTVSPATGSSSMMVKAEKSDGDREHKAKLNHLATSTKYYVVVTSKDKAGNTATSSEVSFTTTSDVKPPKPEDTTSPEIHGLTAYNVTKTSAEIAWITTEKADTKVFYSTSTPVVATSTTSYESSNGKVYFHHVKLNNLTASTTYYFLAQSTDEDGNVGTSSQQSFVTGSNPAPADTTSPVITNVQATTTSSTATVTWSTNEVANGKVWYGTTTPVTLSLPTLSVSSSTLATSHSLSIAGLATSTTYYYSVVSADGSGNSSTVTGGSFVTQGN